MTPFRKSLARAASAATSDLGLQYVLGDHCPTMWTSAQGYGAGCPKYGYTQEGIYVPAPPLKHAVFQLSYEIDMFDHTSF